MTTLNQRILIPTGPSAVWAIISDINKNPNWQTDCRAVSFLTSLRAGARVRWRSTSPQGDEYVIETTAWYDGLGYEYTYVDGAPFRQSKGTIRLQEIAEGTIITWTLNYEMGGPFSGLRNSLGVRRRFDTMMIESLKALWTHVKETGGTKISHEARSLMRDAPDYEARAQYIPRHSANQNQTEAQPASQSLISEPPLTDEDTKPNVAVAADTPETPPIETAETSAAPEKLKPDLAAESSENDVRFRPPDSASTATNQPDEAEDASTPESAPIIEPPLPVVKFGDTEQLPVIARDRFGPRIDTKDIDTKEISIWEVFDIPKPSEIQRLQTFEAAEEKVEDDLADTPVPLLSWSPEAEATPEAISVPTTGISISWLGFRLLARQRLIKIRRRK